MPHAATPHPPSHVYRGVVTADGEVIVTVDKGTLLPPRLDLHNHSPTGFAWGYEGSGPAQLALGLLAHHFGAEDAASADLRALELHQRFKSRVVARLAQDAPWVLRTEDVARFVDELAREEGVTVGSDARIEPVVGPAERECRAGDETGFPLLAPGTTWYCPRGCQAFEPRLPHPEPPECGSCGAPMSTDPSAFHDVLEAIENRGIAEFERAGERS